MKVYILIKVTEARPHGLWDDVVSVSTNKSLVFNTATRLSHKTVNDRSSWKDEVYWVHIFENKTGKKLDELEFDSNGRRKGTFGKIVRNRGSRDQKVVGTWRK